MSQDRQQGQGQQGQGQTSQSQMGGHTAQGQQIQGWNQVKGQVQQKWNKLTESDLQMIGGQRGELVGRLQERYGYARGQAEQEVDNFMRQMS
jgi:uncharacterized protein YjbJ (UPF0337 family)